MVKRMPVARKKNSIPGLQTNSWSVCNRLDIQKDLPKKIFIAVYVDAVQTMNSLSAAEIKETPASGISEQMMFRKKTAPVTRSSF